MSSLRRRRRDIKKSQESIICRLRKPHRSWSSLVGGDQCALIWRIFVTLTKKLTYFGNFNAIGLIWISVNCQILKKQSNHLVTQMEMKARIGPSAAVFIKLQNDKDSPWTTNSKLFYHPFRCGRRVFQNRLKPMDRFLTPSLFPDGALPRPVWLGYEPLKMRHLGKLT